MKPLHLALALIALIALAAVALLIYEPGTETDPRAAVVTVDADEGERTEVTAPLTDTTSRLDVVQTVAPPTSADLLAGATMPASYRASLGGIFGRLVEENGDPVPQMTISLLGGGVTDVLPNLDALLTTGSSAIQPELGEVETDDEGRFRFAEIEPRVLGVLLIDPGGPRVLLHLLEETPVSGGEKDLGDIVMPLGVTLTGVVVDERGEALPGVRVRATDLQSMILSSGIADFRAGSGVLVDDDEVQMVVVPSQSLQRFERLLPFPTTTSDNEGRWTLEGVRQGLVSLVLDDNIHVTNVHGPHSTGTPGNVRDLGEQIMLDGLTLTGRVVDDGGKPVPHAEVMAGNQLIFGPVAILHPPVHADEKGHFEVPGLRPAMARAAARKSPDHIYTVDTGGLEPGAGDITVILPAARTLTLALVDEDDEPIESLRIFARHLPMPDAAEIPDFLIEPRQNVDAVSQDEDGRWLIEDLDPGVWDVLIAAEGFGSVRNTYDLTHADLTESLILHPATTVTVKVVQNDDDATPVEWALVSVRGSDDEGNRRDDGPPQAITASRCDDEGEAELQDLAAGEYVLEVTHPAFAVAQQTLTVPVEGEMPVIVLNVGGSVVGTVVENGGPPSKILMVTLRTEDTETLAGAMPRMTLTGLDGSFAFANVEPGEAQLQARDRMSFTSLATWWEPFAMTAEAEQDVWVTSAQETDATLVVGSTWADLETGFVRGRLLVNGQPAAGWKVRTWGSIRRSVSTAEDGTFVMGYLEAGTVLLMFHADASQSFGSGSVDNSSFELAVDEQRFVEVSISTGAVEGRVVSGINGQPLSGANVALKAVTQAERNFWGGRGAMAVTDAAGQYRFDVVSEGEYTVTATADGFARSGTEAFSVSRQSTARGINVRLERAVSVSGQLAFEGTDEVPSWLWLTARSDNGGEASTRPDKETLEYSFDDMSPNTTWTFQVVTSDGIDYEPIEVYIRNGRDDLALIFSPEVEEEVEETDEPGAGGGSAPFVYEAK